MGLAASASRPQESCFRSCMKGKRKETKIGDECLKLQKRQNKKSTKLQNKLDIVAHQKSNKLKSSIKKNEDISLPQNIQHLGLNNQIEAQHQRQKPTSMKPHHKHTTSEQRCQNICLQGISSGNTEDNKIGDNKILQDMISKPSDNLTTDKQFNSRQKDRLDQAESTTRSSATLSSESKNMLLNKIEAIKQRYFERQLEIQIYEDEKQYEQQLQQLNQIQETFIVEYSFLPQNSLADIKAIRDKILNKIRQKKQQLNQFHPKNEQISLKNRENPELLQVQPNQQNGTIILDKSQRKQVNDASIEEEKIQFSQDFSRTLHEIKELDEQQDEYKSKLSSHEGNSKVRPNLRSKLHEIKKSSLLNKLDQIVLKRQEPQSSAHKVGQTNRNSVSLSRQAKSKLQKDQLPCKVNNILAF